MSPRPSTLRPHTGLPATARSPEQARFDKLTQQIEQARARLAAWQEQLPVFMGTHRARLLATSKEVQAIHVNWLHELDRLLGEKGWTQRERDCLEDLLCETAWHILESQREPDPTVQALYDRHAARPYAHVQASDQEGLAGMMRDLADMDPDLGLGPFEDAFTDAQASPNPGKPSKAQARQQAEAELTAQSLRDIYRKLASALHPDREPDPVKRDARTALMQRVNQAHDQKDLLALLTLQIETAQICPSDIAQTAPERLKRYNKALSDQLAQVQAEVKEIEFGFRMDFMVPPAVNLHPHQLIKVLDLHLAQMHHTRLALERDLATFTDRAATKRWIKRELGA